MTVQRLPKAVLLFWVVLSVADVPLGMKVAAGGRASEGGRDPDACIPRGRWE